MVQATNITPLFFRVAIEATIDAYTQSSSLGVTSTSSYQTVDALARLFVLLIAYQPDAPGSEPLSGKKALITQVLSIITLVLVHNHEQNRTGFNQKPFFRLVSSMLYGFDAQDAVLEPVRADLLVCMR